MSFILSLPVDVFYVVSAHLTPRDVFSLMQVNSSFAAFFTSVGFWKVFYEARVRLFSLPFPQFYTPSSLSFRSRLNPWITLYRDNLHDLRVAACCRLTLSASKRGGIRSREPVTFRIRVANISRKFVVRLDEMSLMHSGGTLFQARLPVPSSVRQKRRTKDDMLRSREAGRGKRRPRPVVVCVPEYSYYREDCLLLLPGETWTVDFVGTRKNVKSNFQVNEQELLGRYAIDEEDSPSARSELAVSRQASEGWEFQASEDSSMPLRMAIHRPRQPFSLQAVARVSLVQKIEIGDADEYRGSDGELFACICPEKEPESRQVPFGNIETAPENFADGSVCWNPLESEGPPKTTRMDWGSEGFEPEPGDSAFYVSSFKIARSNVFRMGFARS